MALAAGMLYSSKHDSHGWEPALLGMVGDGQLQALLQQEWVGWAL